MRITDAEIEIKNKIFGKSTMVILTDLKSIEFGPYLITFHLHDRDEMISYSSNAEASIEIKSLIREVAENNDIKVIGGQRQSGHHKLTVANIRQLYYAKIVSDTRLTRWAGLRVINYLRYAITADRQVGEIPIAIGTATLLAPNVTKQIRYK